MARISEFNLYDVEDLEEGWNRGNGWQGLASFCSQLGFGRDKDTFDGDPKCLNTLIWDASKEVFNEVVKSGGGNIYDLKEFNTLLALAWVGRKRIKAFKYEEFWTAKAHYDLAINQRKPGFRKTLQMVVTALHQCENLGEVVKNLANKESYAGLKREFGKDKLIRYETINIAEKWRSAFSWLGRALSSEIIEEEAWWNCAWLLIKSGASELLEIRKQISADKPLTNEQFRRLNWHIGYGYPRGYWIEQNDGAESYQILLETDEHINLYPLKEVAVTALIQPAFKIAQELHNACSKPRFTKQCRAPSCGKLFYTGRENATACPAKNSISKSLCALEWVRYKRFIQKIGRTPEKCWDNEKLQQQFVSNYNS